jgi:hypothetical protein
MRPGSLRSVLTAAVAFLFGAAAAPATGDDMAHVAALIDRRIEARLQSEGLKQASPADDAEFLRRIFLDLHGVVPSADRAAQFLNSPAADKRETLIDELLASPRFGQNLANIWCRSLISPAAREQRAQTERFTQWLADRFNGDARWDRIVADLLTATGTIDENPAVTYLIEGRHPLSVTDLTDLTSRYFLGVRLNCAQCHDHPFVAWKQQDYWGMAAFFAQIQTPNRPKVVYSEGVQDNPQMTLAVLANADAIDGFHVQPPTVLGGGEFQFDKGQTHREALANWITSADNPYFARAAVNRTWWHLFGRGLVNPVDDMHTGNLASHPELLDALSAQFVESGFDLRFLLRAIMRSRTYQQTSRPGEEPDREAELFARMSIKSLSAEQLYDSLIVILGPPKRTSGIDARLGERFEFAQFFADDADHDPTQYGRGIPHVLRLMNSPQFAGRNINELVSRTASSGHTSDEIVSDLFLAILSRRPRPGDWEIVQDHLASAGGTPESAYAELAWALLLSSEFSLNH